jgi:pimeloyl-ACP methyl ester carboxylesterase
MKRKYSGRQHFRKDFCFDWRGKTGHVYTKQKHDNPVLLFVHGGPGFPNYFLFEKYNPGLEDYFTVCYWEQRGGGLSYTPEVTMESMTA